MRKMCVTSDDKNSIDFNDLEIKINVFEIRNGKLDITACFDVLLNDDCDLYIKSEDQYYRFDKITKDEPLINTEGDNKCAKAYFDINFDLKDKKDFEILIKIKDDYYSVKPLFKAYSKLNELPNSYYTKNGLTVTRKANKFFINEKGHFRFIKYLKDVLFIKKDILVFGMLVIYKLVYPFVKHDNWIISDRFDVAGDNGEWIFKYICNNKKKENVYFALSKNSKDIGRMKEVGKVLHFNTVPFFIRYMNSEVVLSSHVDDFIRRTFGNKSLYMNAFMDYRFVFLQHGVTINDTSNWLFKFNKNIDMLVCSANMEYNEFLKSRYLYNKDVIKLTGFPRYDNLAIIDDENAENLIAFMPTWRSTLCGPIIPRTQSREYNKDFKESSYYKFYNGLVKDEKLVKSLEKHNCKILFCLHPSLASQLKDFENTEFVEFATEVYYPDVFKKAKLMLTDYSSVAFDFAYTRKPIIYSQYDKDVLYQIHTVLTGGGDFKYDKDGFGPVTYDYDSTLNELIKIIESGFENDKKYIDRADKFFEFNDDNNCQRVYDEVVKMLKDK